MTRKRKGVTPETEEEEDDSIWSGLIAVIRWDTEFDKFNIYGRVDCSEFFTKLADKIIRLFVDWEELEQRFKSNQISMLLRLTTKRDQLFKTEMSFNNVPSDVLDNWAEFITGNILNNRITTVAGENSKTKVSFKTSKTTKTKTKKKGFASEVKKEDIWNEFIAFIYWNQDIPNYELYGVTDCSPYYRKLLDEIIRVFVNWEEVEARMKSNQICLTIKMTTKNEQLVKVEVMVEDLPPHILQKLKDNVTQAILNDRIAEIQMKRK